MWEGKYVKMPVDEKMPDIILSPGISKKWNQNIFLFKL